GAQGVGFDGIRLSLASPLPASLVEPALLRRQQRHPTFSDCTQPGCPARIRAPIAVFRPLGSEELDRILSIEIGFLQQRIFNSANATPFVFNLTTEARGFLLQEGTDLKYGARHLKRAIERALVHPLSNLIASGQVSGGDVLRVDFDEESAALVFIKEAEDVSAAAMATMIEPPQTLQERAAAYRLAAVSAF